MDGYHANSGQIVTSKAFGIRQRSLGAGSCRTPKRSPSCLCEKPRTSTMGRD
jgi:hypothetical protein